MSCTHKLHAHIRTVVRGIARMECSGRKDAGAGWLAVCFCVLTLPAMAQTYDFVQKWPASSWYFSQVCAVSTDNAGNVYVADALLKRVQKLAPDGRILCTWGTEGTGDGEFSYPSEVAVDASGNVYVLDIKNQRVQKFTSSGGFIAKWDRRGPTEGCFEVPVGIATDGLGNVYVEDYGGERIQKFTSSGTFVTQWRVVEEDPLVHGHFSIAADFLGNVYVATTSDNRIQKFSSTGKFLLEWHPTTTGSYSLPAAWPWTAWATSLSRTDLMS